MVKSDICRLVMMYSLGGFYFDTEPRRQRYDVRADGEDGGLLELNAKNFVGLARRLHLGRKKC